MTERKRRRPQRRSSHDSGADIERARAALARLSELLGRIHHRRAAEVAALRERLSVDPEGAWRELDGNAWWAGAGSLAADTLIDNPGLPDAVWQAEIRDFRELLIEIGELLRARGDCNPGLSSWVLAFRNWNASEV
jgi:hypothetical protein